MSFYSSKLLRASNMSWISFLFAKKESTASWCVSGKQNNKEETTWQDVHNYNLHKNGFQGQLDALVPLRLRRPLPRSLGGRDTTCFHSFRRLSFRPPFLHCSPPPQFPPPPSNLHPLSLRISTMPHTRSGKGSPSLVVLVVWCSW